MLGHEILSSIAVGVTLGLGLAIYLRLVGRQLLAWCWLAIGFGLSDTFTLIDVDSLFFAFLAAGFVGDELVRPRAEATWSRSSRPAAWYS